MICRNHPDVAEGVRRCANCSIPYCSDCLVELQGRPYCANCKNEKLLDVRSGVDRTTLNYAPILKRFGAQFIDGLLLSIPTYMIMFALLLGTGMMSGQGGEPNPLINLIGIPLSFIGLVYEGLMLQYKGGQTLGKMALGLKVVRMDGSPITPGQAWGRAGLRMVVAFCCCGLPDYIPAFFTDEKTTLHDMAAGTRVVEL
jgi:uncharacterized RDD family membrane protein YckC